MTGRIWPSVLLFAATASAAGESLEELAAMMEGTFVAAGDDEYFSDRRIRMNADHVGDVVFYLELRQGEDYSLYRQRVLVFEIDENGRIRQTAYTPTAPERLALRLETGVTGLELTDIERTLGEGCDTVWTAIDGGFRGYTDPAHCVIVSSRSGRMRHIEAETVITSDGMSLVERGYDVDGKQLFGTPQGESLWLRRVPAGN